MDSYYAEGVTSESAGEERSQNVALARSETLLYDGCEVPEARTTCSRPPLHVHMC